MNDRIQGSCYDNPYWYRGTWRIYVSHDDDDRPGYAFCDDATGAEGFGWTVADAARKIDGILDANRRFDLAMSNLEAMNAYEPAAPRGIPPWLVIALGAVAWAVVIVGGLLLAQVVHALLEPGGTVGARWPW